MCGPRLSRLTRRTRHGPRKLIEDVVARFGGLDILVNNAAIGVESGKTIDDPSIDTAELDRMHATNYTGVIATIRAAAKVLRDNGRIVNIGSGIGSRAGSPGFTDYAATKAGLIGCTKGAARDLAQRGITVNIVQAGLMQTSMEPPSPEALEVMVSALAIQRVSDPAETGAGHRVSGQPSRVVHHRRRDRFQRRVHRLTAGRSHLRRRSADRLQRTPAGINRIHVVVVPAA